MLCHVDRHANSSPLACAEDVCPFALDVLVKGTKSPLHRTDHIPAQSFETDVTNDVIEEESEEEQSPEAGRPSRRRLFAQGIRNRAASFKLELSFGKKDKVKSAPSSYYASRKVAIHSRNSSLGGRHQRYLSRTPPSSKTSSANSSGSFGTPLTSPSTMAARTNAANMDPAAAMRRRTITESKARTHRMAVDEERALRERMRRNGTEDRFPNYKFVDFIGKGTYGRVYQA